MYFPPKPSRLQHRPLYLRTARVLIEWLRTVPSALPQRTTPVIYCDASDGIGIPAGGREHLLRQW
eukprot:1864042-Pyramimonas_sp.AAC.1